MNLIGKEIWMNHDTKERILLTALHLFARDGYEAVSVSQIAGQLGITKGALYKHYQSKRDIFDTILHRMAELDAQRAVSYALPEAPMDDAPEAYRAATMQHLMAFTRDQFRYWTEVDFPASFRKMLTLEQHRSAEMGLLYQQYLVAGPMGYVADLFIAWHWPNPQQAALAFYAPMFFLYSFYDGAATPSDAAALLEAYMEHFLAKWGSAR
jgi:AcrR family transcriptional regulator